MASPLSDLDELILKCRNKKVKAYIKESILCYKSGAFRSSIISTWIAVTFDIIDKLKDLELTGDKEAKLHIGVFEKAVKNEDISALLKFEREILEIARDKLEFISHMEFIDLKRLQDDRNRCAHPSTTIDGEIFNPPAELARVHIRTAIESLLQHPPVQGKAALSILIGEVKSEYFPRALDKATIVFNNSPLNNARQSLVRNFIICLLKTTLKEHDDAYRYRAVYALNAVENMHRDMYSSTMKNVLSKQLKLLKDENLYKAFLILAKAPESWEYLEKDVKLKLETYIENLPIDKIQHLEYIFNQNGLEKLLAKRIKSLTMAEIVETSFIKETPSLLNKRIIDFYIDSASYDQANEYAKPIIIYSKWFSKEQVEKTFKATKTNGQISDSHQCFDVLKSLENNKYVTSNDLKQWALDVKKDSNDDKLAL